jgi:SAM-dependent methyltransferase
MNPVERGRRLADHGGVDGFPDPESLVDEQIAYYRARAPEYDDWWLRTGRYAGDDAFGRRWDAGKAEVARAVRALHPAGSVLELAAGTGNLTRELCRVADRVTAVDASAEALAIARRKLGRPSKVTFVHADVFAWRPPQRFDVVAFGFWLSHVPPGAFGSFWGLVDDALAPAGRVLFIDNAVPVEDAAAEGGRQSRTPWSRTWLDRGVSLRTLSDGRRFHIVKRTWAPEQLRAELAAQGWTASVRAVQGLFLVGSATRTAPA